jgi:hypothetical protein
MKMINKTMGLTIFIMVIIGISLRLSAQFGGPAHKANGFVVLSNGDTLPGLITWSLKYVENNPVEIKFEGGNGSFKIFNASEILGFGQNTKAIQKDFDADYEFELENYVSIPSMKKGVPVFMNRLLDGRIKVFQNRFSSGGAEVVSKTEKNGIGLNIQRGEGFSIYQKYKTSSKFNYDRVGYSSYFVNKDNGTLIKVEKNNYESLFPTLFGDCPGIDQELEKNPGLREFKNFMILAGVYNQNCK